MKSNDVPEDPRGNRAAAAGSGSCFEVRVEPIWLEYQERESGLGFFERRRALRRVRGIVRSSNDWLTATRVDPGNWHREKGERVAHLQVARMGLVHLLQGYIENVKEPGALGACPHLEALRDRGCFILPPDFRLPFPLALGKKDRPVWVLSAPRLRAEFARFKDVLRVSASPGAPGKADFVNAREEEIRTHEVRRGSDDEFWARLTSALLVKAIDRSLSHELPAIVP